MTANHTHIPTPPPQSPWWPLFVVGAGVIGLLLLIRWAALTPVRPQAGGAAEASAENDALSWVIATGAEEGYPIQDLTPNSARWERLAGAARNAVDAGHEATRRFVMTFYGALDERTPGDRLAILGRFFASRADVDLRLPLVPGPNRTLQAWPTLRVALFEYLALRDAEAARVLAESWIQSRPDHPAEWAVALRELIAGKEASTWLPAMRPRISALLTDEVWVAQHPPGWAEALDIVAAGKAVEFLPQLARLANRDQPRAVQYAAHDALQGLTGTAPALVLEALNLDTSLLANNSGLRAGIFARADVRVPEQLRALEVYLGRPDVMAGERAKFTAQFPHHLASAMPRLFTQMQVQSPEDMAAQDRATIEQIDRWLADDHFAVWRKSFEHVRSRLSARANG